MEHEVEARADEVAQHSLSGVQTTGDGDSITAPREHMKR